MNRSSGVRGWFQRLRSIQRSFGGNGAWQRRLPGRQYGPGCARPSKVEFLACEIAPGLPLNIGEDFENSPDRGYVCVLPLEWRPSILQLQRLVGDRPNLVLLLIGQRQEFDVRGIVES